MVYLLFVAVFLTYIFSANRVHNILGGKYYAARLSDNVSPRASGNIEMISIYDYPPVNNRYEEGKGFRGEFLEIANRSGNARIRVFLRSSIAIYEVISNRRSFWAHSRKIAINFFTSTSGLEKGIYQVGVYLSDDSGERFIWMDSFFQKAVGGPAEYVARPIAPIPAKESENLHFAIERIEKNNNEYVIQGWIVLDNREMNDFSAYLIFKDFGGVSKTFYAPLYTRMDIASLYADACAANSGFRIRIPQSDITPGNYEIRVELKSRKKDEAVKSVMTDTRAL